MKVRFTEEQKKVIDSRNSNILVSAAAGSGKTAVLVERIIKMITDEEHPCDIDKFLVVTFTDAAAGEMRDRISAAIEECLKTDPENIHLQKQAVLIHKARISTIHSFCLDVIRNNFNSIGLDPAFRTADSSELEMLEDDVIDRVFEKHYENKDGMFLNMVDYLSQDVGDASLREYVKKIYKFAQGYPWPDEWLDQCAHYYNISDATELKSSSWMAFLMTYIKRRVADALRLVERAIEIAGEPYGPSKYLGVLNADYAEIESLLGIDDYDKLREMVNALSFGKLPPRAGDDVDAEMKEHVMSIRKKYKEAFSSGKSKSVADFLTNSSEKEFVLLSDIKPYVNMMILLVKEFEEEYLLERKKRGIISFPDMEHYALDILCTKTDEGVFPSKIAMEYRDSINEILMDEYQDCNRVQDLILRSVSREGCDEYNNRFMVGDVKQSIYKFRMANPQLFINKYNSYSIDDPDSQCTDAYHRINLHKNFRSRKTVIDTVNDLFGQIMLSDLGEVEYDEDAKLVEGATYPEAQGMETEYILLEKDTESELDKGAQEAMMIAHRIKGLLQSGQVTDKITGELRQVKYKDIAILVRSMTDVAMGLKTVLAAEGIPAVMTMNSGFFETKEIQQLVQLLKVIDNPRQDIPLYGAMHSYFGKFSDEELAKIKTDYDTDRMGKFKGLCLYDYVLMSAGENPKTADFVKFLEDLRKKSRYIPIHRLIELIVGNDTGYMNYVTAMAGGRQRKANIGMLIAKAEAFEATSFKGLFNFVRYLEKIKKMESDVGEAEIVDGNANVVRIMTIHKSKGLEFPVCILAGSHKKFNDRDLLKKVLIDMDYGLGVEYVNMEKRVSQTPLFRKVMSLKMRQDLLGEELRVLYVALTRAKEKLIISGVITDAEKLLKASEERVKLNVNGKMPYSERSQCISYMDFMPSLVKDAQIVSSDILNREALDEAWDFVEKRGQLLKEITEASKEGGANDKPGELYQTLVSKSGKPYPHPELERMVLKTSVSELKKAYMDYENGGELFPQKSVMPYEPLFIVGENHDISGTERGNAYHRVMELLDFNDQNVKTQINKMMESGKLSEIYGAAVSERKIGEFFESPIARRMAEAQRNGKLRREQPFVLGIPARRVNSECPDNETVLLQGIIDAFFIEDGKAVLVDYKTDVIKNDEELKKRYYMQMVYYRKAIESILQIPVTECYLYSFCLGEAVEVYIDTKDLDD